MSASAQVEQLVEQVAPKGILYKIYTKMFLRGRPVVPVCATHMMLNLTGEVSLNDILLNRMYKFERSTGRF